MYFISLIVAERIKKIDKNINIIFAGPHASLCSLETLEAFDFIDMIAIGEGEKNIISIIDYFNNKEEIENIKGICYRKSDRIIYNEAQPLNKNLDELPMIEFGKNAHISVMPVDSGRGCPYNCTFCCTKTFWQRKLRLKSTDRLIDEIKHYMDKYNIRQFDFVHDIFTADRKKLLELCNEIVNFGIEIEWSCNARADNLDEEVISSMIRAGCKKIYLGIETGSQRMQKEINKNLDMLQVKDTIKLISKYNTPMMTNFIWGFPLEKEEDLLETINLIRFCVEEMSIREIYLNKCRCFPGTHIYSSHRNNLIFNEENFYLSGYPAKQHVDFIRSYPDIFSCLFSFDDELIDKYFYLDSFVTYIYRYFAFVIPKTISEIITYFNNNLLDFYLEYEPEIKRLTKLLTKTIYCGEKLRNAKKEMLISLEHFIKDKMKNEFIDQLYRFEMEIRRSSLSPNSEESKVQTFDYDMLLYYQKLIKKKEKCKLVFTVTEDKEVSINKEM